MTAQVVAKLVRVKEPAAATALEVAAGGRLYQVRMHPGHKRCEAGCSESVFLGIVHVLHAALVYVIIVPTRHMGCSQLAVCSSR